MSANTLGADINEIWLAYLLNNNSFPGTSAQDYTTRVSQVSTQEISEQQGRAKASYDRFLLFLSRQGLGSPVAAHWTARPGSMASIVGFPVDQSKNPTDVLVELDSGEYYGISLKSVKSGKTGFKNPGMGTIESDLGLSNKPFSAIVEKYKKQVIAAYPQLNVSSDTARKTILKQPKNKAIKDAIYATYGKACLDELSKALYNHLTNNMDPWEQKVFLGHSLMNEDEETMKVPYVKLTGSGTGNGPFRAQLYDPVANSKARKIAARGAGFVLDTKKQGTIKVNAGKSGVRVKYMFSIRWKWSSTYFASSMKLSAE